MSFRDHVHLYLDGGTQWQWRVLDVQETPIYYGTFDVVQTGDIISHSLTNTGVTVVHDTIELVVILVAEQSKTFEERKTDLRSMLGRQVKYVPHEHDESPLAPIYNCLLQEIGAIRYVSPALQRAEVPVKLLKASFV